MAIDHYTKWVETKIFNDKKPLSVIKAMRSVIFAKHGMPEKILTDCGREFTAKEVQEMFVNSGIKHITGSSFHHQTTRGIERVNRTFMSKLRKLSNFKKKKWRDQVSKATLAVNLSYHRAFGTSPFIWIYQRVPELQIDKQMRAGRIFVNKSELERTRIIIQLRYNNEIAKGTKEIETEYEIGDNVYVYRRRKNKMDEYWQGGYQVQKKMGMDAYIVKSVKGEVRVNKIHMKKELLLGKEVLGVPSKNM